MVVKPRDIVTFPDGIIGSVTLTGGPRIQVGSITDVNESELGFGTVIISVNITVLLYVVVESCEVAALSVDAAGRLRSVPTSEEEDVDGLATLGPVIREIAAMEPVVMSIGSWELFGR